MAMDEAALIAIIRMYIEVYRFDYDPVHLARHMAEGGFNDDDIVTAVMDGDIIESSPERSRWLFAGFVTRLQLKAGFRGRWLHVSIEYIEESSVIVVTAYRPNIHEWETERRRR